MPRICNSVEGVHRQAGWPKHHSERDGVSWLFMRPSSQPEARTAAAAILPALFVVCVNFLERVSVGTELSLSMKGGTAEEVGGLIGRGGRLSGNKKWAEK